MKTGQPNLLVIHIEMHRSVCLNYNSPWPRCLGILRTVVLKLRFLSFPYYYCPSLCLSKPIYLHYLRPGTNLCSKVRVSSLPLCPWLGYPAHQPSCPPDCSISSQQGTASPPELMAHSDKEPGEELVKEVEETNAVWLLSGPLAGEVAEREHTQTLKLGLCPSLLYIFVLKCSDASSEAINWSLRVCQRETIVVRLITVYKPFPWGIDSKPPMDAENWIIVNATYSIQKNPEKRFSLFI